MKLNVYCIKDVKVGEFESPFYMKNHATAIRACVDTVEQGKMPYAADKELFCLGEFDTESGLITSKVDFIYNLVDAIKGGANA